MTNEQLYELSYDEIEKYYSDKELHYLPLFASQSKDLFSFLSEQNDIELKDEEILGTLFARMSMSDRVTITDEFVSSDSRRYAKILPKS